MRLSYTVVIDFFSSFFAPSYVFIIVWPLEDLIKTEMALDMKKVQRNGQWDFWAVELRCVFVFFHF